MMYRSSHRRCSYLLFLTFISASFLFCQRDTSHIPPSTVTNNAPVAVDTLQKKKLRESAFRMAKSPLLAVGLSALVPGAGQLYTKNYWKVPVILGLGGYWVYEWIKLNNKYSDFRDQYAASISASLPNGNERYLSVRDFYRDERDKFAWYLGGLYFINLVDAYVGAHLYDFDVSPDLSADGRIVPRVTAMVRVRF